MQVYAATRERMTLSPAQFMQAMEGWRVVPVTSEGEIVGGVLVKGNEIHIGVTSIPPGAGRVYVRVLQSVIAEYGHAVTTVMKNNEAGIAFCKRLGFVVRHENEGVVFLRCERCNHA